jgi:hypothetical protein
MRAMENPWVVAGLIVLAVIYQIIRFAFRSVKKAGGDGMARLNAAAERILKERNAGGSTHATTNPIPRTQSLSTKATRSPNAASKPRPSGALLPKSTTPAVMRRDSLLSGRKEPVIQRRR